jgi:peptidyl-tRNA hydrolase, PTH1 family
MKPSLVIVGLGNTGDQYAGTRHNVGFDAIEKLAEEFKTDVWKPRQKFMADICEGRIVAVPILMVKPTTFMNRSGECIRKLIDFYKLDPAKQLLVISDDIDLEVGDVRLRKSGSAGTHNGLKSIVEQIGEEFPRLRIGIGAQKSGEDLAGYVLSKPSALDREKLDEAVDGIYEIVQEFTLS